MNKKKFSSRVSTPIDPEQQEIERTKEFLEKLYNKNPKLNRTI